MPNHKLIILLALIFTAWLRLTTLIKAEPHSGVRSWTETAPWPTLHHDNQRSGFAQYAPAGPITQKWYRAFYDELISTQVEAMIAEKKVYFGTFAGNLYALNAADGETAWRFQAGGPIGHSPCYDQGRIYFGAADGFLYCLSAADGKPIWKYDAEAPIMNAPACDGSTIYIGDRAGVFHAVDGASGKMRWTIRTNAMILKPASISPDGERIVFGAEDMTIYCFSKDGHPLWHSPKLRGLSLRGQGPTICGDKVIVRTNPGQFFHAALWVARDLLGRATQPAKFKTWEEEQTAILDYLRSHPEDQTFFAFNLEDGSVPWTAPVLYTGGCHTVATPPTFNPVTKEMVTLLPTRYGAWTSGVSQMSIGLGKIDVKTGKVEILPSPQGPFKEVGYHEAAAIADETSALSIVGGTLLITHQGGILGRRFPDLKEHYNVAMARDTYGGIYGPAAWKGDIWKESKIKAQEGFLLGAVNEWHGPDRGIASTDGERIYWVTGSQVVCLGGPRAAVSEKYNRVWPVKRTEPSFVSGGNVVMGVGGYDASVAKIELTAADVRELVETIPQVRKQAETPEAGRVRHKLDNEIDELVHWSPWKPFTVELGISGEEWHFWRTAKNIAAVSLALPHLSLRMRYNAIEWLDHQIEMGKPLEQSSLEVQPYLGNDREFYDVHPTINGRHADQVKWTTNIEDIYALWAYAHYAERWDRIAAQTGRVRALVDAFKPKAFDHGDMMGDAAEHLNAQIAGLIGAARVLRHAGDAAGAERAETLLARLAADRIHHERADSLLLRGTRECTRIHQSKIPRYVELYPEVAWLLRKHAGNALETHVRGLVRELPLWYQAWCERMIGGEVFASTPTLMRGLAAAWLDGVRPPAAEAVETADVHWCRADLYYIEKLSAILRLCDGAWNGS